MNRYEVVFKIRLSKKLRDSIIEDAQKREKKTSVHVREQLDRTFRFSQTDIKKIEEKGQVDYNSLNDYLQTHLIDVSAARSNDFEKHIVLRAKLLLDAIEKATGKIISGKDSDEVISKFGERLIF